MGCPFGSDGHTYLPTWHGGMVITAQQKSPAPKENRVKDTKVKGLKGRHERALWEVN